MFAERKRSNEEGFHAGEHPAFNLSPIPPRRPTSRYRRIVSDRRGATVPFKLRDQLQ
jgi:hypothetical protein